MQHNAEHGTKHKTKPDPVAATPGRADRRPFTSLPLPQQAALLCQDKVFWRFLMEEFGWDIRSDEQAAEAVRERCGVLSRAELATQDTAARRFIADREHFMAWKLVG